MAAAAASGGGRFRPALYRLLIGRLADLWAGPAGDLVGPLEAVTRFLVVPTRRLLQPAQGDVAPTWVSTLCRCGLRRDELQNPPRSVHSGGVG